MNDVEREIEEYDRRCDLLKQRLIKTVAVLNEIGAKMNEPGATVQDLCEIAEKHGMIFDPNKLSLHEKEEET